MNFHSKNSMYICPLNIHIFYHQKWDINGPHYDPNQFTAHSLNFPKKPHLLLSQKSWTCTLTQDSTVTSTSVSKRKRIREHPLQKGGKKGKNTNTTKITNPTKRDSQWKHQLKLRREKPKITYNRVARAWAFMQNTNSGGVDPSWRENWDFGDWRAMKTTRS